MILFISTGGTIDKLYPRTVSGYSFEFGPSSVGNILERIKPKFAEPYEIVSCCAVDSQDMTNDHRDKLVDIIVEKKVEKVIVTHGTDTMIETAEYIAQRLREANMTVVITGAFLPESFKGTDADFNVGVAIGGVGSVGPGVFVAMNGKIFPHSSVGRSKEGTFTSMPNDVKQKT